MDCTKCKVALKEIMSRPRPKALLSAIDHSGIKTLEDVPESKENELRPSTLNIKCLDCSEEGMYCALSGICKQASLTPFLHTYIHSLQALQ